MNRARVKEANGLECGCCPSCHEDDERGEGPCAILYDGEREMEVCCDVQRALLSKGIADADAIAAASRKP